jgi:hypothetical protein
MLRKFYQGGQHWRFSAALTLAIAVPAAGATAADTGMLQIRCTNPASGATWPIAIDLGRNLVDSRPATITDKWISWDDPKQGVFELERATGKLRFRNASSTGGYFVFYTCLAQ